MARRRNEFRSELPALLDRYAASRVLEFKQFDRYHYRIADSGITEIDLWTSGRYYIRYTEYQHITSRPICQRSGEKGVLPRKKIEIGRFLDTLFYAADVAEEDRINASRS